MPAIASGAVALGSVPRLVAAGGDADVDALSRADDADLLELRADLFDEPTPERVCTALTTLRTGSRPIILTVRAGAEGGRALADDRRESLYRAGLPLADALDVEIASAELVGRLVPAARAARKTVILSAHAPDAVPPLAALLALVARGQALGADVVKLAAFARTLGDLRVLLEATLAARPHPLVTLAMGPAGPLSRLLL